MLDEADVFLFPSLHDEGSWVVAEAVACGLPVVCLDRGGPPVLGGMPVRATTPRATVRALAKAVREARGVQQLRSVDTGFQGRRAALAELIERFELLPPAGG
jgi:glycosyltransferase involved in cell wall biosynthesis